MQVRVFESPDMATGLQQIKKELGPDALILSTRTVRSGKLGLLGKPMLEITAAIDTDHGPTNKRTSPPKGKKHTDRFPPGTPKPPRSTDTRTSGKNFHAIVDEPVTPQLNDPELHDRLAEEDYEVPHPPRSKAPSRSSPGLESEVSDLKDLVQQLADQIARLTEEQSAAKSPATLTVKPTGFGERLAGNVIHGDHLLSHLIDRGINVESARTIAGFLRESMTDQELGDEGTVQQALQETIRDLIQVSPPALYEESRQQRIALVGPTGVGKTTTLAKLAAAHLSRHSPSVALITIDTYRIAAVEQLRVYGEIMRLPVEVVINPRQLRQALDRHRDKDLILIDTAGRSPRDGFCIDELATFLTPELDIHNSLVVSATTRETELIDTIERFNVLNLQSTIFTKIDECANLGIILNVQIQNPSPLAWVTNGQRVPEDLLEITPARVAELILSNEQGPTNDEP